MAIQLRRAGLRAQIAVLGVSGALLLGLIYADGARTQAALQQVADSSAHLHLAMITVDRALAVARQAETDFLIHRREALIATRERALAEAGEALTLVEQHAAEMPSDDPLRRADAIRPSLNLYATRFQNVAAAQRTLGFNETQGLQGRLREAVHQVEARLAQSDLLPLNALMLTMRRHEKDFMLRGGDKYVDALRESVDAFEQALKGAPLAETTRAELRERIRTYEQGFLAYAAGADTLKEEAADLDTIVQRLQPLTTEVRRTIESLNAQAQSAIAASRETTTRRMLWAIALTVLCTGLLSLWVGQRISRPLGMMARAMEALASGDLAVTVPTLRRRDELGAIAAAFAVFHAKMVENRDLTAERLAERLRSEAERRQAMLALADRLETEVGGATRDLAEAAARMQHEAQVVSGAVAQTGERAVSVAATSEQTSANVHQVSAATEELTASIGEISAQVTLSAQATRVALQEAGRTGTAVRDLAGTMDRVGEVVGLIAGIADQTNLLALNATIEAARAGESGRSFAVVATEVKALAGQTARATGDIRDQIAAIRDAMAEAIGAASGIEHRVGEMSTIAEAIAATMEQQSAAVRDIAGHVVRAATGTQLVSGTIAGVSSDVDRAAGAASGVSAAARSVADRSRVLADDVSRFLVHVRAA